MFSLDIDFLKDRGLDAAIAKETHIEKASSSIADKIPIIAGAIIAVVLPFMTYSYSKTFAGNQAKMQQEIQQLEAAIAKAQGESKTLEEITAQVKKSESETKALVGVFEKIRPWSAIIREVGDRTPPGIQIGSITQSGSGNNIKLKITGKGRSYSEVNDFVLFLQRSPFFNEDKIILGTVKNSSWNVQLSNEEELTKEINLTLPDGVDYSIEAQLANKPNSELVRELNSKGSLGLLTRLKTLESKGVIIK
ncbi:Tfp pilus assembly protein PilN [Xenococcus sp. PCC 7305]|uniref:PilN domain-containing protein n=1 Tax=Xenococcus sp. PCC 7305 TaxID=102125 RepID=UPI0002AC52CB|nr:PilN domain-containing protein [Xenococcus sp. PCC 7305]ELS02414.1 Tfp pilus assembly protein PilN [Xenococcus sp. PCC 7305]